MINPALIKFAFQNGGIGAPDNPMAGAQYNAIPQGGAFSVDNSAPQPLGNPQGPALGSPYPNDSGIQSAEQMLQGLLNQHQPSIPLPAEVHPAYRTPDLGKLAALAGLSLLFKHGGQPEFLNGALGGYVQGKEAQAQQTNQTNQRNWQLQTQDQNQTRQQDIAAAQNQLNTANADYNRQYQAARNMEMMAEKAKQDREDQIAKIRTAYNQAKGSKQMEQVAKSWRALDPNAPDELAVKQDWADKSSQARNIIIDNWGADIERATKYNYGVVPKNQVAALENTRRMYEAQLKSYGIENPSLPPPPTEQTIRGDIAKAHLDSIVAKMPKIVAESKYADEKILSDLASAKSLRQYRDWAETHGDTMAGLSQMNADTARLNYEYRVSADNVTKSLTKKIADINGQIQSLKARQGSTHIGVLGSQSNLSTAQRQKIQSDIDAATAARDYYDGLLKEHQSQAPIPQQKTSDGDPVRQQAQDAIAKGADPAKVKARYKQMTGKDF